MVRALAEFIMRGRAQAAAFAGLCFFVPFLSSAAIALVTLRRGGLNGFYILVWALLPYIVFTAVDVSLLPFTFLVLTIMAATIGGALVLRSGSTWPVSVLGLLAICATGGFVFGSTFPEHINAFVDQWNSVQAQAVQQLKQQGYEVSEVTELSAPKVTGIVAYVATTSAFLALLVGRWWQAMLYNPGGFQLEFHQFRLNLSQALFCFGLAVLGLSRREYDYWGLVAALPLFLVSVTIVHNIVAEKKLGKQWLIAFYILTMLPALYLVAVVIGLMDSWVDFRKKILSR
ncbi:hypothetical protein NBRC116492_09980 [Aurantivibrio infirmus]